MPPAHPGEILQVEFLDEMGITKYRLARDTQMPASRVGKIIAGQRGLTADTALRLARYLGTSAEFWLDLQSQYDLEVARDQVGREVDRQVTARAAG